VARAKREAGFRDFPGRRWLIVVLRAIHLVGLVGTGAILLGGQPFGVAQPFVLTLFCSGLAMLLADLCAAPRYLGEISGAATLLKLLLLAWFMLDPAHRLPLFWGILVFSALIAHAPARLRHRRLFGASAGVPHP